MAKVVFSLSIGNVIIDSDSVPPARGSEATQSDNTDKSLVFDKDVRNRIAKLSTRSELMISFGLAC